MFEKYTMLQLYKGEFQLQNDQKREKSEKRQIA